MAENNKLTITQYDFNTTVSDFIEKFKGSQADCFDLAINDQVVPKYIKMQETIKIKFQERQVNFTVRHNNGLTANIEFGLSKTIKSLKDHLCSIKMVSNSQHQMTLNEKYLDDDATLNECKIVNGSVLCVKEKEMIVSDLIQIWKSSFADYYDLVAGGIVIPRHLTLRQANISGKLNLKLKERKLSFIVRTLTAKIITVELLPSKTILQLKQLIESSEGTPPHHQRLVFDMKQLDDEHTLKQVGIKNDSMVHLVLRLRGG